MLLLPNQANTGFTGLEKITTYILLAKLGCPVFPSALIAPREEINQIKIQQLREYFNSEEVTVRYQYTRPNHRPRRGGNRCVLQTMDISAHQSEDCFLWLLNPVDRLKNDYGINVRFLGDECVIEIVGRGFDVSDLNRGDISPHETIISTLPIRMGVYLEWWKFLRFSFVNSIEYELSKTIRRNKLQKMGYSVPDSIFSQVYTPLPMEYLDYLLAYISKMYSYMGNKDYCTSCSVINGKFVFWDIQTPKGKSAIYGVE